jgi:SAM-dependent methyltransferase
MTLSDAYGRAMLDRLEGAGEGEEIVERDDGYVHVGAGPSFYLAPFRDWGAHDRGAMRFVRGRVLDIGCGAGRVALHLQERSFEVLAIDTSPLAIQVCRLRGVRRAEVGSIANLDGLGVLEI